LAARLSEEYGSVVRRGRVAFVEVFRQWPAYFLDSFMAVQAADVRDAGHEIAWLKGFLVDDTANVLDDLCARLLCGGPWDLLVVERVWSRDLMRRLWRAAGEPPIVVTPWAPPGDWDEVTHRISPPSRRTLVRLVEELLAGREPAEDNLFTREIGGRWRPPASTRPLAIAEQFAPPVRFAYDAVETFGLDAAEVARTRYLMLNMGCPYRTSANTSGFLDGLDLPTDWGSAGCTFCNVGPYEAQSAGAREELVRSQLEELNRHGPYERLVVIDEFVFRDLDRLAQAVVDFAPRGVEIMVRARVDYLTTHEEALTRALELLAGRGSLTPYLIGFENFSDAELQRYNKGLTAAENLAGVRKLMALAEKWPHLNLSPSQGFILFGPWTTMSDLKANAEALAGLDFRRLRGGVASSKLRLNPDAALVARARADGLLLGAHARADEDNAASTGYQAEIPYRFADPATERVWSLLNGPDALAGKDDVARLQAAIARVEAE